MSRDIREIAYIDHKDVVALNFIQADGRYIFRRHFRQGLRSHIMEILDRADVEKEKSGIMVKGNLFFPKAKPFKMLRIFRTRFSSLQQVLEEIERFKITEHYLTAANIAQSTEIIVDYKGPQSSSPLLCGLQEYVEGVILDPWSLLQDSSLLTMLYDSLSASFSDQLQPQRTWSEKVLFNAHQFVKKTKTMIQDGRHVPDLAGIGNVLITPAGRLKLVDINNISKVVFDEKIRLDDRNYPVCDKSIEALALIEGKLLGRPRDVSDPIYGFFLTPERLRQVEECEKSFARSAHASANQLNT